MILAGREITWGNGHTAGRELLRQMYQQYTGMTMPEVLVTERGKPYFQDGQVHFSISHTDRRVFCVLSHRPVGVDAEERSRVVNPKLAEKILSPEEWKQYCAAEDKNRALLTFWVLKEAQAKCTGAGLNGYPNQTHFCLTDPRVMEKDGCVLAVIEQD